MKGFCWGLMVLQYVFVGLSTGCCRAVLSGIHSAAHKKHQVVQSSITGTTVGWLEVIRGIFARVGRPRGLPGRWLLISAMICIYSIRFNNWKRSRQCRDVVDFAPI